MSQNSAVVSACLLWVGCALSSPSLSGVKAGLSVPEASGLQMAESVREKVSQLHLHKATQNSPEHSCHSDQVCNVTKKASLCGRSGHRTISQPLSALHSQRLHYLGIEYLW